MRKKLYGILCILVITICLFTSTVLGTDAIEELQQKQQEINTEIKTTNTDLEEIKTEISEAMIQLQELNDKIYSYELESKTLELQIKELSGTIEEAQIKLEEAENQYTRQRTVLENRLIEMYEAGRTTFLDVLLASRSLREFISNYYLISEITAHDNELLEAVGRQRDTIQSEKQSLDEQKENLKKIKDEKEKKAIMLENMKTVKNNYLSKLSMQEQELQTKIEEYQKNVAEIESQILLMVAFSADSDYVGGVMAWPVPGYTRITSSYGMRTHPITGVYKLHTGVDIGAPIGVSFIAANDGIVTKAEYNYAYGNMVMIDHGGGVSTLYGHGSQIMVQVGQTVKRGDIVLKVGSTGYSTGPHAHFEVRVNGRCVEPLNYILSKANNSTEE